VSRRKALIATALGCIVIASVLVLVFRALKTSTTLTVENRTVEAVEISINDEAIGCWDSAIVPAGTTMRLDLTLDGAWHEDVLCLGTPIYLLAASSESQEWQCLWEEIKDEGRLVFTDLGPESLEEPGKIMAGCRGDPLRSP
jgi:hypothetical protein